jgi:chromosome segregation ATPase
LHSIELRSLKEKINDNEIQIKRLQNKESNYILDMKSLKEVHEKERLTFVTKIGTLNTEMKSISLPITSDDLSNEETFSKLGSRINLLRHRVSELEVLVDQMQARNNQLMMDKNHLQTELSTQIHEKDDIIVSYESKIMILQKDIHDRMTFIDEPQRIQTLHNLMKESEAKSVEIASLMMKLEISEGTRKAVNETTKYILQQTHEDTTRLVNDQHGRTFELIKSQMLKDSNTKESKLLESQNQIYTVRFNQLQDQLLDVKGRYSDSQVKEKNLREQMENLEASLSEAKRENILLVDSLEISKNGWSPSMHKFDELSNHIRKLERDLNDREEKLSSFLLDNENCSHQYEINELLALLGEKDDQIRTFKKEMQYIVNGIIKLKKAIPHKMG